MTTITTREPETPTQRITGTRFGVIDYVAEDIVLLAKGLVGLSELQRFVIVNPVGSGPFRWLQSLDEPGFALLMTSPDSYVDSYSPAIPAAELAELSNSSSPAYLLYVTVTIPAGRPQDMTLNLRGPIVINAATGLAAQCVLDDETYTTKHRVFTQSDGESVAAA